MNVMRRIVVGIAGVVVVALALELVAPKAVHAVVATLVQVSNTSANPVPTMAVDTRSVNVVNTPNVNATINGTVPVSGNVNATIGGSISAAVSNPAGTNGPVPLETAEVNNPAYQPASLELYMDSGASASATVPSTLPGGGPFREFVINWVTGACANLNSPTPPASVIDLQTDGSQISIFSETSSNGPWGYFGTKTNLYASPGSTITLSILGPSGGVTIMAGPPESIRVSPTPNALCLINADGYYVTQ